MARCLNSYAQKVMHEEHYEEDVDDEDLDDDDVDGYEGLSDYDEDDIPGSSGYGSHSFGNTGSEGKSADLRRQRSISEGGAVYCVEAGEDNRQVFLMAFVVSLKINMCFSSKFQSRVVVG